MSSMPPIPLTPKPSSNFALVSVSATKAAQPAAMDGDAHRCYPLQNYLLNHHSQNYCSKNHQPQNHRRHNQQGVALLTVLLLVVAITVLAGSMLASQKVLLRQYELLLTQDQIVQDVRTGQQLAVAIISADAKVNAVDSAQDAWAQGNTPTLSGTHSIALSIKDASARFNINNLYHDGARDTAAIAVLQRLLQQADLPPELAYAVLDWQDPDAETSAEGGAEADAYMLATNAASLQGAGQAGALTTTSIANQPFISVDELLSVRGFSADKLAKLRPYLSAVPYYVPVNLNTADAAVLSAIAGTGTAANFAAFSEQRQRNPMNTVAQALAMPPWAGLSAESLSAITPMLSVESQAFQVLIDVSVAADAALTDTGTATRLDTGNKTAKHRYATTYISKLTKSNAAATASEAAATQTALTSDKTIAAFGTRLWSYRPDF